MAEVSQKCIAEVRSSERFSARAYRGESIDMDTRLNLTAATVPRPRAADSEAALRALHIDLAGAAPSTAPAIAAITVGYDGELAQLDEKDHRPLRTVIGAQRGRPPRLLQPR